MRLGVAAMVLGQALPEAERGLVVV